MSNVRQKVDAQKSDSLFRETHSALRKEVRIRLRRESQIALWNNEHRRKRSPSTESVSEAIVKSKKADHCLMDLLKRGESRFNPGLDKHLVKKSSQSGLLRFISLKS